MDANKLLDQRRFHSTKPKILLLSFCSLCLIASSVITFYFLKDTPALPIKIGIDLPQTGDFSTFGILGLQGAQLAVEEINRAGGVLNGRPFELIIGDNQSDPNVAVRLMRKFIQEDDVFAVIGPVSSAARNAMTEVAEQFKIPLLYGIDYEGGGFSPYVFFYSAIPEHVVVPLLPYLAEQRGSNKYYIFGYDYEWPHGMAKAIQQEAGKHGGHVVGTEFTPFGVRDYSQTFDNIQASGADTLILVMCGLDGQRFSKQLYQSGLKRPRTLVAIAAEESWEQGLSAKELEGIITITHFIRSLDRKEPPSFVSKMESKFGKETVVTYSTKAHYALVMMLRHAIEKVGSTLDREKVIVALESEQFRIGSGLESMRADHHMNLNMFIAAFRNGVLSVEKDVGLVKPRDQRMFIP